MNALDAPKVIRITGAPHVILKIYEVYPYTTLLLNG